jgi:rRNA pseudouridine-1189 N-methylase Emg1 (Nep1/Mra1 family)
MHGEVKISDRKQACIYTLTVARCSRDARVVYEEAHDDNRQKTWPQGNPDITHQCLEEPLFCLTCVNAP